ncbi:MAG TPA: pseudouridine synthase [Kofleriaceae bacterium]
MSDDDEAEDDDLVTALSLPPGADPTIDWGLTAHLKADGTPKIIERHLVVSGELAGLRLDHFIVTQIPRLSRTRIQDVIATQLSREGGGGRLKPATTVVAGEHYVIRRPARAEPPCPRTLDVLVSDPRLYVISKPPYLPVHASAKFYFNTLTRVMDERFPDEPELQICHRLDRETSGCLVVARDRAAAATLKQAFATKTAVTKEYLAIVRGVPPWTEEHVIELPLRVAVPGDPTKLPHVRMLAGSGAQAITRVRVERVAGDLAVVRCLLVTGRQHQIRAHLAARGFPIVGDKLYGPGGDEGFLRYCNDGLVPALAALFGHPRHALHAARVSFPHPDGGRVTAEAPLPPDLTALLG